MPIVPVESVAPPARTAIKDFRAVAPAMMSCAPFAAAAIAATPPATVRRTCASASSKLSATYWKNHCSAPSTFSIESPVNSPIGFRNFFQNTSFSVGLHLSQMVFSALIAAPISSITSGIAVSIVHVAVGAMTLSNNHPTSSSSSSVASFTISDRCSNDTSNGDKLTLSAHSAVLPKNVSATPSRLLKMSQQFWMMCVPVSFSAHASRNDSARLPVVSAMPLMMPSVMRSVSSPVPFSKTVTKLPLTASTKPLTCPHDVIIASTVCCPFVLHFAESLSIASAPVSDSAEYGLTAAISPPTVPTSIGVSAVSSPSLWISS